MLKQIVNGKNRRTIRHEMSAADAAILAGVLVGKIEVYTETASAGTDAVIATPNFIKMSVGKKTGQVSRSASFYLPHRKASKSGQDIETAVIGQFDQDFFSSTPCEYANVLLEKK